MSRSVCLRAALSVALATSLLACKEETRAEKAARKFDEAVEKIRHGNEGKLERAGRKIDDAVEDAEEALEDARDEAEDAVEELREEAAGAIEGN
jgi:phosphate uptake regulator